MHAFLQYSRLSYTYLSCMHVMYANSLRSAHSEQNRENISKSWPSFQHTRLDPSKNIHQTNLSVLCILAISVLS